MRRIKRQKINEKEEVGKEELYMRNNREKV